MTLPTEEEIAKLISGAPFSSPRSLAKARAILSLIRPAFEAKDAEIETLKKLPVIADYIEVQEHSRAMEARALSAEANLAQAAEALEPFVSSFEAAREAHGRRYGKDEAIGLANFDKMPDRWPMDDLKFDMGTFRRARSASAAARGETDAAAQEP